MRFFFMFLLSSGSLFCVNEISPPKHLIVKSTYGAGFFSEVLKVFDAILYFSKENLKTVEVDWSQEFFPYKTDLEENGWNLYFEPIEFSHEVVPSEQKIQEICGIFYHELHDFQCVDQWVNYDRYLPYRLKVHDLIQKYLIVKQPIAAAVEHIFKEKMADYYCIGVHVRYGSDHGAETPRGLPSLQDYITEVKNLVDQQSLRPVRIYLATDSHYVIKEFRQNFSRDMLITIDTHRSDYRDTPHLIYGNGDYWLAHEREFHRKKPGYYGGKGVLMDALLLAHCDILVHSTSNIVSFVTFYNPYIESLCLPRISVTWPCRHGKVL